MPELPPARSTIGTWLRHAERRYRAEGAAVGQIASTAHDDALFLILRTLGLPLASGPEVLARRLTPGQEATLGDVLQQRIAGRTPSAYLTREAWLGGLKFYVDERVIVPRSYFVELIPSIRKLMPRGAAVRRVVDICTGSGCLAVLLAREFPSARVDAVDLSPDALEVARTNVRLHRLTRRVTLFESDVLTSVPPGEYDVILSNPPYEPSARVDGLPAEFHREPRLALDGGPDGMAIIRRIVQQAATRLAPQGILLIEVGGLRRAIDREFSALNPVWLETGDGSDCVCLFRGGEIAGKTVNRKP